VNIWEFLVGTWTEVPVSGRLIVLFVIGVTIAGQLNRAIFRWTWKPKHYDPWTPPLEKAGKRFLWDKVPLFGWLSLSRESSLHGFAHWVQPFLIELGCGFFFAWYYHWTISGETLPAAVMVAPSAEALHALYVQHIVLFCFMLIATFIDFDSRIIPDQVTVPGFLIGLVFCWALPFVGFAVPDPPHFFPLHNPANQDVLSQAMLATTPEPWPESWNSSIALGVAIVLGLSWWLALCPKIIWFRSGSRKFFRYLWASFVKYSLTPFYLGMLVGLLAFISAIWVWGDISAWQPVFSGLLGMAFAGLLIWFVRVFASVAMGQEAMGFGDVTLMCMIGVYTGWQPMMIVFFLAPFIACVFALANYLLTGDAYLAYGPYLCIGTLIVMICWSSLWQQYGPLLQLGPWLPVVFLLLPVVLGLMLMIWQWIKFTFIFPDEAAGE